VTALLILAAIVALSIVVLLWLCHRAPVIDEPDWSFPGKPIIYIEHEPLPPLDQRFRQSEGIS
jgi:hypothetical protein